VREGNWLTKNRCVRVSEGQVCSAVGGRVEWVVEVGGAGWNMESRVGEEGPDFIWF
jgi:hypothetical protein